MRLSPWLSVTVLAAGLTACGGGPLQTTKPSLLITTTSVDFGCQPVLTKVTRKIHFSNVGRRTLTFTAAIAGEMSAPLTMLPNDPSCSAQVPDMDAGDLDAGDGDAGMPADAGDTDAGMPADAGDTDAGAIDGGTVDAGATPDAGDMDAGMTTADAGTADGGAPSDAGMPDSGTPDAGFPASGFFTISFPSGASSTSLTAGQSVDALVTFDGSVQAAYSANFVLTTDDTNHPMVTIPLTAWATTAAAIKIDPAGCIDFGSVPEGQTAVQQVKLSSVGTAPLQVQGLSITGMSSAAYAILGSTSGTATINNGLPLPLNLKFQPQSMLPNNMGVFNADLQFSTNDPDNRLVDVCLTGQIAHLPVAVITIAHPMEPAGTTKASVPIGAQVTLDGSKSFSPDGSALTYLWHPVNVPMGSAAPTTDSMNETETFTVDTPGEYDYELTVSDTSGLTSVPALAKIIGVTSQGVEVQLTWDTPTGDLDLHMRPVGTALFSPSDCYGYNPTPMDWPLPMSGMPSYPVDMGDKLSGFGPEIIDYKDPGIGRYQITIVYNSAQGTPGLMPNATVRVFEYGSLMGEFTQQMTKVGEQWNAAWIDWPSQNVTAGAAPP